MGHVLKYIEWVELRRFWKKGMILLQIFIDSDNWLTKNLIRRYLSSLLHCYRNAVQN